MLKFASVVLLLGLGSTQQCSCPNIYRPVCGTNGVTYPSECHLSCAGVGKLAAGICSSNQSTGQYEVAPQQPTTTPTTPTTPTTTTTTTTPTTPTTPTSTTYINYPNYPGYPLPTQQPSTSGQVPVLPNCASCPSTSQLVCGSNGVTYQNDCTRQCAGVSLFAVGACPAPLSTPTVCYCSDQENLVCGADGKTYQNECVLSMCAKQRAVRQGACPNSGPVVTPSTFVASANCSCPNVTDLKCGANQVTYQSLCHLQCANAVFAKNGAC